MCAYVNVEATQKFLKKHKNHKSVTVYKYLIQDGDSLYSPFFGHKPWLPGEIKSNSTAKLQTQNGKEINRGIHVYLTSEDALNNAASMETVIQLKANIEDLICVDGDDNVAVFTKVELSKAEYTKAIKG